MNPNSASLQHRTAKVGILLLGNNLHHAALKFALVCMNDFQDQFIFELLPKDLGENKKVAVLLGKEVAADAITAALRDFAGIASAHLIQKATNFPASKLSADPSDAFVIVSMGTTRENKYVYVEEKAALVSLGGWKRNLAPPSLLEFALVLTLRATAELLLVGLKPNRHISTRGCLFDFTEDLDESRLKILNSFVCGDCSALVGASEKTRFAALLTLLNREWLGDPTKAGTCASTLTALGYRLHYTKGIKQTAWELSISKIQEEGAKTILAIIGGIAVLALAAYFGIKD